MTIPAVAVADYFAGTLVDPAPRRAAGQQAFLDDIIDVVPAHAYDRAVAGHHGEAAGPRTGTAHRHKRRAELTVPSREIRGPLRTAGAPASRLLRRGTRPS